MHMMSHVEVHFPTTYHMLLEGFGESPMELITLNLTICFQKMVRPPIALLASQ